MKKRSARRISLVHKTSPLIAWLPEDVLELVFSYLNDVKTIRALSLISSFFHWNITPILFNACKLYMKNTLGIQPISFGHAKLLEDVHKHLCIEIWDQTKKMRHCLPASRAIFYSEPFVMGRGVAGTVMSSHEYISRKHVVLHFLPLEENKPICARMHVIGLNGVDLYRYNDDKRTVADRVGSLATNSASCKELEESTGCLRAEGTHRTITYYLILLRCLVMDPHSRPPWRPGICRQICCAGSCGLPELRRVLWVLRRSLW